MATEKRGDLLAGRMYLLCVSRQQKTPGKPAQRAHAQPLHYQGTQDRRRLALVTQTQPHCRGGKRCSKTQPSGAEVPGRRRGPHRKNQVEVGQRPSLLLTPTFPWVADATPHTIPCLTRHPSSLSARRGQVLPAVHREVLPVMSTLLRLGSSCPRLTSLDKLTQGSLPQDPSLTKLRDGTDA